MQPCHRDFGLIGGLGGGGGPRRQRGREGERAGKRGEERRACLMFRVVGGESSVTPADSGVPLVKSVSTAAGSAIPTAGSAIPAVGSASAILESWDEHGEDTEFLGCSSGRPDQLDGF